jgi:hypothetical protein
MKLDIASSKRISSGAFITQFLNLQQHIPSHWQNTNNPNADNKSNRVLHIQLGFHLSLFTHAF